MMTDWPLLLPAVLLLLTNPVAADVLTVRIDAAQAVPSQGSTRVAGEILVPGNGGTVQADCDTTRAGDWQVWVIGRCPQGTDGYLEVGLANRVLGQQLPASTRRQKNQRYYLGTVSLSAGTTRVKLRFRSASGRFRFSGLELVQAPVLHSDLLPLFDGARGFYDTLLRADHGLYRNVYLTGRGNRPSIRQSPTCSIAAVGIGLMSLCMSHELDADPAAETKALQTLRTLNGKNPQLQPDRDRSGFFRHFFALKDGQGKSEFSTIDTAIVVVGALYCRNIFPSAAVRQEADELWASIDWSVSQASPDGLQYYRAVRQGRAVNKSVTHLFNEYYILAWLVQHWQAADARNSSSLMSTLPRWSQDDLTLLCSRRPRPQCSFVIQFPFYMSAPGTHDPRFLSFVAAQAQADHRACLAQGNAAHLWGCGAGGTPDDGYVASSYARNPDQIVSPAIIAGFMPAYPVAQDHLRMIYQNPARRLVTAAGDVLPRFSMKSPAWRHHRIESIDYSSMLFGLAAVDARLGLPFFRRATRMTFPAPNDRGVTLRH